MMKRFIWLIFLTNLSVHFLFAATYTPLSGVPLKVEDRSLTELINYVYRIFIFLGVAFAIVTIAFNGFKYMFSDIITDKQISLKKIKKALGGLILLLSAHFLLSLINPDIVKLQLLDKDL